MEALPLVLKLRGRPVLVVGGGAVALRKIEWLLRVGAKITVVAPSGEEALARLSAEGKVSWIRASFSPGHVPQNLRLAILATDDRETNRKAAEILKRRGVWVNVVDDPALSDLLFPAIVDRTPLLVAISSSGKAPILVRWLRAKLERLLPHHLGKLAERLGKIRERVKRTLSPDRRRAFWHRLFDTPAIDLFLSGREAEAEEVVEALLAGAVPQGYVALVGAGPGDPGLLTLRGFQLLQTADVVVYDRLVHPEILDLARRDAERIYAGKSRREKTMSQEEINRLLIQLARKGKRVVRLKGGDPLLFGRGGEEALALAEAGVPFLIVPGITAALGCAASAGIPLTHRDLAHACLFVTGHRKGDLVQREWRHLLARKQTVVIYMGLLGLPEICRHLIEAGLPPEMPAAIIERGTLPGQRVITATLETLPAKAASVGVNPPTLVVIGEVVRLRERLQIEA